MTSSSPTSGSSPRVGSDLSPFIVFTLDRNIRISLFPTPLPSPLETYQPTYAALDDGSLITGLYRSDLFSANSRLFGIAALLTLGSVNVWTCVQYITRGKVKDKTLFWLLLASQILLPVCFAALISPFFLENVNCTVVNVVSVISTELSYSILITGILGLKAYRCLSRSKLILYVVWILQLAIWALFAFDLRNIDSSRRISGSCGTNGSSRFVPIALVLTVVEALFLTLCFLYAVWKSTLSRAAQGRLSIAISEKTPFPEAVDGRANGEIGRRGWWDYVPRAPTSTASSNHGSTHGHGDGRPSDDSLVKKFRDSMKRLTGSMDLSHYTNLNGPQDASYTRKPSIPTEFPLSQPPRQLQLVRQSQQSDNRNHSHSQSHEKIRFSTSAHGHHISDGTYMSNGKRLSGPVLSYREEEAPTTARTTSVKSVGFDSARSSKIDPLQPMPARPTSEDIAADLLGKSMGEGNRVPAVLQVRVVIKEEMIATALITLSCAISTGLAFWRAKEGEVAFGPSIWLGANWAAISLIEMRCFSQVVRRHERDAILQSPSLFGSAFAPNAATTAMARRRRDALALVDSSSTSISPFPPLDVPGSTSTRRRKLARRSSWGYANSLPRDGDTTSLFEENASLRRREGLRAWDEEKERRRLESQSEREQVPQTSHQGACHSPEMHRRVSDPFADFLGIPRFGEGIEGDHEDGDIGRRKSGEGPVMIDELMLEADSVHRQNSTLQKPLVASPWSETLFKTVPNPFSGTVNPFASTSTTNDDQMQIGRRRSLSPFATMDTEPILPISDPSSKRGSNETKPQLLAPFVGGPSRVAPMVLPRIPPTGAAVPPPSRGVRRGAIADAGVIPRLAEKGEHVRNSGVQVETSISDSSLPSMKGQKASPRVEKLTTPPLQTSPSPPQSHNGSSIELLESNKFGD